MITPAPLLETRSLTRMIGDKKIINDLSTSFAKGKVYTIIGPSGAGKSSLLRLLNRLDEPTSGQVLFHGESTDLFPPCRLRCKIGYLFQTPHMFPGSVRDNLLFAECALEEADVERLADLVHIDRSLIERDTASLSIGQQQRVAMGRLLATSPEIALLDEPTSALDPTITEAIEQTIHDIVRETDLTVIMVTHNPEQSLRMSGETLLLVDGVLAETGPCEQVISNPQTDLGRRYKARQLR